jgi:hypothetical protein
MMNRRPPGVLIAVSTMVLVSACSGSGDDAATDDLVPAGVDEIREQPFDLYLGEEMATIGYALTRIAHQCEADEGYPEFLEHPTPRQEDAFSFLRVSVADLAEPERPFPVGDNIEAVIEKCTQDAWSRLGAGAEAAYVSYLDLGNSLASYTDNVSARRPDDQFPKYADCLAEKGFPPIDRDDYLADPSIEKFGIEFGDYGGDVSEWEPPDDPGVHIKPEVPARKYTPTKEESDFAAAIFACQWSLEMPQWEYTTAIKVQEEFMAEYEHQLRKLNPTVQSIAKTAARLI